MRRESIVEEAVDEVEHKVASYRQGRCEHGRPCAISRVFRRQLFSDRSAFIFGRLQSQSTNPQLLLLLLFFFRDLKIRNRKTG